MMNHSLPLALAAIALITPALAVAQAAPPPVTTTAPDDKKPDRTKEDAQDVLSQPVKDVGITKDKIPPALVAAANAPYDLTGLRTCQQIADASRALDAALGPDYPAGGPVDKDSMGKKVGGAVVNSLIPLRGVVREVSGAAAADRRLAAAVQAGFARRGFLRGVHTAQGCKNVM